MNPTVLGVILISALVALWVCWLVLGQVSVYEISATARVEAERVYPVAAAVGGRIVASHLSLARQVRSGDVLLEIEAERERLETTEERTRLAALDSQLAAIGSEIEAEEHAIALVGRAAHAAVSEASQKLVSAQAMARQAEAQHERTRQLLEGGLVAEADFVRATAEMEVRQAEVASIRAGLERLHAQQAAEARERRAHLGALLRERIVLDGQKAATASAVTRREVEAEERQIRAPVDGWLGEITPLQVGAVIHEGDRLASIVPSGQTKNVVALFPPSALGHVRAGQPARFRLEGFPWTQYGHVPATVQRVATETREGRLRVELAVHHWPSSRIPFEHGLPGTVEVEVERAAPAALLIRTLGQAMATADAHAVPEPPPGHAEPAPGHAGHAHP